MKRKLLPVFVCALVFAGCDIHRADVGPDFEAEILVVPGGPTIWNPSVALGSGAFGTTVVSGQNAEKGDIDLVTDFQYLRYQPSASFTDGTDAFSIDVVASDGSARRGTISVRTLETTDCSDAGIFDYAQVKQGEFIEIDLLANDFFCGGPANLTSGGVRQVVLNAPSDDATETLSINISGVDETVTITFTAPEDVTGTIDLIYEVGINGNFNNHGTPSTDANGNFIVENFDKYIVAQATIEIVE